MPIELIGTIAVAVLVLAIAAGVTARAGRVRPLIIGLGLAALPVGFYLTGWLRLTINGINSLIDWFQRTVFTNAIAWGVGLLAGGLVLALIGLALPKKPARERPAAKPAGPASTQPAASPQPLPEAKRPPAKPAAQAQAKGSKPGAKEEPGEFDEIEELLRKRGIM